MEIVINISKKDYQALKQGHIPFKMLDIIRNGIILPEEHGRLIDVNDLDITTITTDDYSGNEVLDIVLKEDIDEAPTIIKAEANVPKKRAGTPLEENDFGYNCEDWIP